MEHERAVRFWGAVVGERVIEESLEAIYAPAALSKFREISVNTGYETKINLVTYRLEKERMLALDMSYPTTVVSSQLCLASVRNAIQACEKEGQLTDTVRFEATHSQTGIELFSLEFDVWAYVQTRRIETEKPFESVRSHFEHFKVGEETGGGK